MATYGLTADRPSRGLKSRYLVHSQTCKDKSPTENPVKMGLRSQTVFTGSKKYVKNEQIILFHGDRYAVFPKAVFFKSVGVKDMFYRISLNTTLVLPLLAYPLSCLLRNMILPLRSSKSIITQRSLFA